MYIRGLLVGYWTSRPEEQLSGFRYQEAADHVAASSRQTRVIRVIKVNMGSTIILVIYVYAIYIILVIIIVIVSPAVG